MDIDWYWRKVFYYFIHLYWYLFYHCANWWRANKALISPQQNWRKLYLLTELDEVSSPNIIIMESFLAAKGLSFSIHNKSPATLYVTGKPLQYAWCLHSVRWNTGEGTRIVSEESRAISASGESSHHPDRERASEREVGGWGKGLIINNSWHAAWQKAVERGSTQSTDLV